VREPGGQPCLSQEAPAESVVAGQVLREQLHGDRPVELLIAAEVDGRHPALAQRALEPVAARGKR